MPKEPKQLRRLEWKSELKVMWQDGLSDFHLDWVYMTPLPADVLFRFVLAFGEHWHFLFDWMVWRIPFTKLWIGIKFSASSTHRVIRLWRWSRAWKRWDSGDEWERTEDDD